MPDFLAVGSFFNLIIQTQFFADFKCHQRPRRCSVPTPAMSRLPSLENCRLFTKPTYTGKYNIWFLLTSAHLLWEFKKNSMYAVFVEGNRLPGYVFLQHVHNFCMFSLWIFKSAWVSITARKFYYWLCCFHSLWISMRSRAVVEMRCKSPEYVPLLTCLLLIFFEPHSAIWLHLRCCRNALNKPRSATCLWNCCKSPNVSNIL